MGDWGGEERRARERGREGGVGIQRAGGRRREARWKEEEQGQGGRGDGGERRERKKGMCVDRDTSSLEAGRLAADARPRPAVALVARSQARNSSPLAKLMESCRVLPCHVIPDHVMRCQIACVMSRHA